MLAVSAIRLLISAWLVTLILPVVIADDLILTVFSWLFNVTGTFTLPNRLLMLIFSELPDALVCKLTIYNRSLLCADERGGRFVNLVSAILLFNYK